ncbi:MAG: phosphate ABC transporter substrate-binding protein PstS [Planctomycetes bacterium]|nr:phosphate ABC transporter substrate-binding protein PstS [Planctomycetota bacterium]
MPRASALVLLGIAILSSAGCSGCNNSGIEHKRLTGAGATFIYPMMSKWSKEYEKAKGVKIDYQSIGSGGGIKQMTAQTVDFGCSEGPLNDGQLKEAKDKNGDVVHIPLAMGAVVPAYNLAEVKDQLKFTGPVLADIFLGKITNWNDPAIKKLNPDATLPETKIVVVHRSDGSGTTYVWVDYLSKVSPEWKDRVGKGTSVNWPIGLGEKGNENVAGQVKRSAGALGYVELTYALQNKIQYGAVQNKEGVFVVPNLESVSAAADAFLTDIPEDLRYSITDAPGKGSYPISGTCWGLAYANNPSGKGKEVRDFLYWCTHDGQQFCEALHYSRLPTRLVERVEKRLELIK